MSGSKDFRFRPYPLASSPKPRGGPSFNYTLAKDQNGDVLVDKSKTALLKKHVGHLSGENISSIAVVSTNSRPLGGGGGVGHESSSRSPHFFQHKPQQQHPGFMVVPKSPSSQQQQQQQVVPVQPPPFTASSLGFKDEIALELSVAEILAGPVLKNVSLIVLHATFYEEMVPENGDPRCREFMVFDESTEKPLHCRYWEIDVPLGILGPPGKPCRLIGVKPQQLNKKDSPFWCFGVKR